MKRLIAVTLTLFATFLLYAQTPKKRMTYYDSLAYSQMGISTGQPIKVDTAVMHGDEAIDKFYNDNKPLPSSMWYGNNFPSNRVRVKVMPLDSLPDEINIRLIKSEDEFCFPVKKVRSSPYGWRWNRPHRGVDIALNVGDPIHCVFPGVVRIAQPMGAYGNLVVVRHYNGLETVYGHMSKIKVKPRQIVSAGTVLGLGGSTGHSTGPHLHFEVRFQYEAFDPEWILDFSNYSLRTRRLHLDKTYFGITMPRGKHPDLYYKADKSFVKERPHNSSGKKVVTYTTQYGDTYEVVARRYKTTPEEIHRMNPTAPKKLKPGVKLQMKIPVSNNQ